MGTEALDVELRDSTKIVVAWKVVGDRLIGMRCQHLCGALSLGGGHVRMECPNLLEQAGGLGYFWAFGLGLQSDWARAGPMIGPSLARK